MKIYLDLVVILNFLVDFLLLLGTNRLSGFPASPLRAAAAAALAAGIAVAMVIKKRKRKETKPEDQFPPEEADRREQTDKEEGNEK